MEALDSLIPRSGGVQLATTGDLPLGLPVALSAHVETPTREVGQRPRVAAHEKAGLPDVLAEVRQGTKRDALLFAVGANGHHGLPRTNKDKRRAVEIMLRDAEWTQKYDAEIARLANVSSHFVGNVRRDLAASGDIESFNIRQGSDGSTKDTSKSGRKTKPAKDTAAPKVERSPNADLIDAVANAPDLAALDKAYSAATHARPLRRARGGNSKATNLVKSCKRCNNDKHPTMSNTYGYGLTIPAPAGLDPDRYVVTIGVHRRNGSALTKAEVAAIEAALAPLAAPAAAAAAGAPATVAKHKAAAERQRKAMVAKATGKAPGKVTRLSDKATKPTKAAGKATGKGRKASKTPTRKAARRP